MNINNKNEPVLIGQSILAALAFIFGGITTMAATTNNDILAMIGGVGTLVTGGLNIGVGYYVRGEVTPNGSVAAYINPEGEARAGEAISAPTGAPVEIAQVAPQDATDTF